jgi:hypothetical protein
LVRIRVIARAGEAAEAGGLKALAKKPLKTL